VSLRPPRDTIPDSPGCYQFLDEHGRVLYVGKARSLRQRLSSYFQDPRNLHPRTAQMVAAAERVDWVVTSTEVEALVLEHSLIQSFQPRYNVRLKDDKSYPWLALTTSDEWPRPLVTRGTRRRGTRYFGPFGHVRSLRRTVDLLLPMFPVRSCSDAKLSRHQRSGRPCLLFDIERCSGPCIGAVDPATYAAHLDGFVRFFSGDIDPLVATLEAQMLDAASRREFERAARLRDGIAAVHEAAESQEVVLGDRDELDIVGIAHDELQLAVVVLHVRHGRIVGRSSSVADLVESVDEAQLSATVLRDLYGDPAAQVPPVIAISSLPEEHDVVEAWLAERRGTAVSLLQPQRGQKRRLVELAERNAGEERDRDRLRRAADHNVRSRALLEVQEALGLSRPPFRIECYDMSHLQGSSYVGSMVVFEDGVPAKSAYRHFSIKTVDGNDDYAAMAEVLGRRLRRWDESSGDGRSRGFASPADLLLIDGGKGQLAVAVAALEAAGLGGRVAVASLAKRFEELYVPGREDPILLPRGSEGLFLLQRIRDEAHRFAIGFHRSTRGRAMTESVLEGVPGLGPERRARLLERFGTVQQLRGASLAELAAAPWLPMRVAEAVYEHLHPLPAAFGGARAPTGDRGADSPHG
jgi:excinuclease ABC subunit C